MSLREINLSAERSARSGEFHKIARTLLQAKAGDIMQAAMIAEASRATPRVVDVFKTAVTAGSLANSALYGVVANGFVESLRNTCAFDMLLAGGMRRVPLGSHLGRVTTAATGGAVGELQAKPVSSLALDAVQLDPIKASAIIIISDELSKFATAGAQQLFDDELVYGTSVASDSVFLSALLASCTPAATAGATADNCLTDLATMLGKMTATSTRSRLYFIARPSVLRGMMFLRPTNQAPLFPNLTVAGGPLGVGGIVAIASDAAAASTVMLVDAFGIIGDSSDVVLDASNKSTLNLESAPDSPAIGSTIVSSLWQQNMRALKCERTFGFEIVGSESVQATSGVAY